MDTWLRVLLLIAAIAVINGLAWALVLPWLRRRGAEQLRRYGAVDPALATGTPIETLSRISYIGTTVDGRRYYAPGWWVRFMGRAVLTADALLLVRGAGHAAVIVPRRSIAAVERRGRFAGRGLPGRRITVISWRMGGGAFLTGVVLGRDETERLRWEARLEGA